VIGAGFIRQLCYFAETSLRREEKTGVSPLSKITFVLVRLDHVARRIVNANHSMM
jgi:hypothetical protein